jgi:chemotaxis protein CheD
MPPPNLSSFEHKLIIGLGEMAVSTNASLILTAYSLGSCIGVTVFDPVVRVGGMLHVMLPDSAIDPGKGRAKPGMFMDTGLAALFRSAYELGAVKQRLRICAAGGAQIMDTTGFFNIGKRNYEILNEFLRQQGLRTAAEQVGGLVNRTMNLRLNTGQVTLRISGQPKETILWTP